MIAYFVLGGTNSAPRLDTGEPRIIVDSRRGHFNAGYFEAVAPELEFEANVHLPSRDKQVSIWTCSFAPALTCEFETLDSRMRELNYTAKIKQALQNINFEGRAIVVNRSSSSHDSVVLIDTQASDLGFFGLHDCYANVSYLMWNTEHGVQNLLQASPLRYLLYRLPKLSVVFLPIEALRSKWWRWSKGGSLLKAFNALEMRLVNGSDS